METIILQYSSFSTGVTKHDIYLDFQTTTSLTGDIELPRDSMFMSSMFMI